MQTTFDKWRERLVSGDVGSFRKANSTTERARAAFRLMISAAAVEFVVFFVF